MRCRLATSCHRSVAQRVAHHDNTAAIANQLIVFGAAQRCFVFVENMNHVVGIESVDQTVLPAQKVGYDLASECVSMSDVGFMGFSIHTWTVGISRSACFRMADTVSPIPAENTNTGTLVELRLAKSSCVPSRKQSRSILPPSRISFGSSLNPL